MRLVLLPVGDSVSPSVELVYCASNTAVANAADEYRDINHKEYDTDDKSCKSHVVGAAIGVLQSDDATDERNDSTDRCDKSEEEQCGDHAKDSEQNTYAAGNKTDHR